MNAGVVELPTRRSTIRVARALGPLLEPGDLLVLSGELGAGKTFFTRALCRALGLPERVRVTSPTFTLVQEHATRPRLVHADVYRLERPDEVRDLGLDAARDDGAVVVVEWGAPFVDVLGGDALVLRWSMRPRRLALYGTGARSRALLLGLQSVLELAPAPEAPYDSAGGSGGSE